MKPTYTIPAQLLGFFQVLVAGGRDGALVSVIATSGSTYTKAGTQMLVDDAGNYQGMVSGGCIEGDLAEHARAAIREGAERHVNYDLATDDELFGLGVGCEGTMQLLVRPLLAASGWEPFASIVDQLEAGDIVDAEAPDGGPTVRLRAPRRVLVLGAGDDADPLVRFCNALGWRVTVADHRPARIASIRDLCRARCITFASLARDLELDTFDAAIVMSHNVKNDRAYLRVLADSAVPFVGLLGPPQRRDRLLGELGDTAAALDGRLRAPVGRCIGGRGPAAVALEIAAELQAYFAAH